MRKKQKIRKGFNRGLIPAKETKNPKTDFSIKGSLTSFSSYFWTRNNRVSVTNASLKFST